VVGVGRGVRTHELMNVFADAGALAQSRPVVDDNPHVLEATIASVVALRVANRRKSLRLNKVTMY
jgi:hypothetical protein